jgi:hypothetical protein
LQHAWKIGADEVAAFMKLRGVPLRAVTFLVSHPFRHVAAAPVLRDEATL